LTHIRRALALASRHRVFTVLAALGLLLRVVTMLGYRWAMWFNDSYQYVASALDGEPHIVRPNGYAFWLALLEPFHSFGLVTALQHLMGLATATLIYVLLWRRFGLPKWAASLAAVPVLFDAYQVQLEHLVLSDVPFLLLMTVLVHLSLTWREITVRRGLVLGLLTASVALMRSIGLGLMIVVIVYFLVKRVNWRAVAALVVSCALPLLGYAAWFDAHYGRFALSNSDGPFLYARVMKFADCYKIHPPVEESALCSGLPVDERPSSQFYVWGQVSPLDRYSGALFSNEKSELAGRFARRAIMAQPGDYLDAIVYDVVRVFRWNREVYPDPPTYNMYQFRTTTEPISDWAVPILARYQPGDARPKIVEPYAGFMRFYQSYFFLPGTIVGIALAAALVGIVRRWREWGGEAVLPWGFTAALLTAPAATAEFDYRYVVPAVPMAFLAAFIALRDLRLRRRADEEREDGAAPEAVEAPVLVGASRTPQS
jgi:hypothetical protein